MSQYLCWIHCGEFLGENLVRKITPRWKAFGFFTFPAILHNLLYPGENTESLIVSSEFFNFTPMSFDIPPVILFTYYSILCVW